MNAIDVLIATGWTPRQIIGVGTILAFVLAALGVACAAKAGSQQVDASFDRALEEPKYPLGEDTMAMLHGVSVEEYQRMCMKAAMRQAGGAR